MARNSMQLILLVAAFAGVSHALSSLGGTSYDNNFDKQCGNDQALYKLYSNHNNHKEDRTWTFYCSGNYNLNDNNPGWTGYINGWDGNLNYKCGANKALVGVSSYHSNHKEDRRWRFKCKSFNQVETYGCAHTGYINSWDGNMNWQLSNTNQVINGLYSNHNNHKEDRVWRVWKCNLCSVSITWHNWGSWGSCPRTCTPVGSAASTHRRSRTARNNRPQPFCSKIDHATKYQTQECNEKVPCPVPVAGKWGCWSGWSKCSNACGIGTRTRSRSCNNPSRQHGGANCPGDATQREECISTEFVVVPNSGIAGHDRKTLTNKTPLECTRACLTETAFSCKSFDFQPSTGKCMLSDKNRQSATLKSGSEFQGWMYQEKKCGSNQATTVTIPTHSPFSDNCDKSNCYTACGESAYGNEIRTGSDIIIRGIDVNLHSVLTDGTIPTSAKKVTVYAQTVKLTRTIDLKYDLVIVARQFTIQNNAQMRYYKALSGNLVINRCYKQTYVADCKSGKRLTLVSYYGNGRVDIYAEGVRGIPSCTTGRIIQHLPKQDLVSLRQAVTCSQILRTASSNGYSAVADNILKYVQLVALDESVFLTASHANSIGSLATKLQREMADQHSVGKHHLPTLSQTAYTALLDTHGKIFKTYNEKYTTVFDRNQRAQDRLDNIKAMLTSSEGTVALQEKKARNAANSCEESALTLDKLTEQFEKSNAGLEKAQEKLEKGIEAYKRKQIVKAVFGFINVIGQLFKSVAKIVIGGLTGNVAMVVGGVGDLVSAVAELAMLIQDTIALADTIRDLKSIAADMKAKFSDLKPPNNADGVLQSVEEVADTRVKVIVWQNIKNTADIKLGSGTITEIDGCTDFRKALADTANWGEALSNQVIAHGALVNTYTLEALALEIARSDLERTRTLYNQAHSTTTVTNELLAEVSGQISEVQIAGVRTMVSYCDTYYYTNFQKCKSNYRFKLSDGLHTFQVKIHEMHNDRLFSTTRFAQNPPAPFKAVVVLKDIQTSNCYDAAKCPVTQLKLNRQITFNIPMTSPDLAAHERVRVEQIRVFLGGVTTTGRVSIQLTNVGTIQDRFEKKTYVFSSVPRELVHTYNFASHTSSDDACIHSSLADLFFQATPFGDYGMKVLNPLSELNLSNLKQIEIYFLGHSIKDRSAPDHHETLFYGSLGKKDIANECLSGASKRKRRSISRARRLAIV